MIGIDNETLQTIQHTAVKAQGATGKIQILDLPQERDGRYGVVDADGSFQVVDAAPDFRRHQIASVDEVAAYVAYASERLGANPVVWYDDNLVQIVLDDTPESSRRDCTTVHLLQTPQWKLLIDLAAASRSWSQKQFIRLLRIELSGCLGQDGPEIIKVLRTIDYGSATAGKGNIQHGRESLGQELESEVRSAAGEIPEQILLRVRTFKDPALDSKWPIRCAIEIDSRSGEFELCPLPDELEEAMVEQLDVIGTLLNNSVQCPIFRGRP